MLKLLFRALFVLEALLLLGSLGLAQSFVLELPLSSQHALLPSALESLTAPSTSPPHGEQAESLGGLVPYGQVWRAGANENTMIEV